jgi:hypothetical protein
MSPPESNPTASVPPNQAPAGTTHAEGSTADPVDGAAVVLPEAGGTVGGTPDETRRAADRGLHGLAVPGYEIIRVLGLGGFGVVYLARQLGFNREVALKVVLSTAWADERARARFLVEAETVAAIRHPHVMQVYDFGNASGTPYIAMEYLRGGSLSERLRASPGFAAGGSSEVGGAAFDPRSAAELVGKLARAVHAAHELEIVHRDLKPANVMFDEKGEPKVTDFGLAKRGHSGVTASHAVMGTPAYMAPEQASGGTKFVGPGADIYALGVILYECLTGTRPFDDPDPIALLRKVTDDEPRPPRRLVGSVPRDLELICLKCLAKVPHERYATASTLADDLDHIRNGEPVSVRPAGLLERAYKWARRRPTAAAAYALGLIALVFGMSAGVAAIMWQRAEGEKASAETARGQAEEERRKTEEAYQKLEKARQEIEALTSNHIGRRVEALLRTPQQPDFKPVHPITEVDELPPPDPSAFRVLEDNRVIDLRGWKQLRPGQDAEECCVINTLEQRLIKVVDTPTFVAETRTSGHDVVMRALSINPQKARQFASRTEVPVGKQLMKVRQLNLSVDEIPLDTEFVVQIRASYFGSLQRPDEKWFGVIGNGDAVKVSMLILFPSDRPFTSFDFRVAPTRSGEPTPYLGPRIVITDPKGHWLYWEIATPQREHVYRVDWSW